MAPMALKAAPTPLQRVVRLLADAVPQIDPSHPAYQSVKEAFDTAAGLDSYLEAQSSDLIVPSTHSLSEKETRAVFDELLDVTESTNWNGIYKEKKTTWELMKEMCSGAYEATVIQQVALAAHSKTVLEIGIFTGTTTLALGLLPEVEKIVALDIEPFLEEFDRPFWVKAGVSHKIETRFAPALDSLKKLKEEGHAPFDLVFIDADKPSYLPYVKSLLDLDLLSPEGIILADNTLYKGYPWSDSDKPVSPAHATNSNNKTHNVATQGIHDFNVGIHSDPRVYVTVLPIRDGVSVIRRKI